MLVQPHADRCGVVNPAGSRSHRGLRRYHEQAITLVSTFEETTMALIYTDQFLHRRYAKPGKIENMATHDRLVLDMVKKVKGTGTGPGKTFHEPVIMSSGQGVGATVAASQLVAEGGGTGSTSVVAEWTLPYGDYFGEVLISDKDIAAGSDVPDGAYLKPFGLQTDGLIDTFGEQMDSYIFAEAGKALGVYSGAAMTAGGVLTLLGDAAETQIMNFELGAAFQVSQNDGSGAHSLLGAGSVGFVIGVDYDALTVTFSPTQTGVGGIPLGWDTVDTTIFLFRNGDFQGTGGGNAPVFIMDSFADWIPATAPGSTLFKGIDRSVNSKFGGARLTATQANGLSTEERIKKLVTKLNSTFGGKGEKLVVMESIQWQKLASLLEKRGQRPLDGKTANMGYQYITLQTGRGMAKVISAPKCRPDTFWAFEIDKWNLRTLNGFPAVMHSDGFQMLRKASSNSYGFRITCYGHMSTPYPSRHGRGPVDITA